MKTGYIIKHFAGSILFFALIFISAGRIEYWQGLIYVLIGITMTVFNYTVFRIDPELLKERTKPGDGTMKWDKTILGLSFLATIAMFMTAGLDSGRFHWSPDFHWSLSLSGIILTVSGQLLFLIAQKQNKFFSSTVRIQANRGHIVCEAGLYSFVRHPAYLGMIIQSLGFPILFGSLWSIVPVFASIVLILVRTQKEDCLLKEELEGYPEYAEKTRYRILPFVW